MRKINFFTILQLLAVIISSPAYAFQVVDVEIPVQMKRNAEQTKTFVVDAGERNRIIRTGDLLAVLRKDEYGSLLPVGILEITATAEFYSKTRVKSIADNLLIQPFGIKGIAVGDSVFPLIMLPSKLLFSSANSAALTKNGMEILAERIVNYLHEGNFKNLILFSYSNRGLNNQQETALAEAQSSSIKKHLMVKHGIAEGMLKISAAGKNDPFNKMLSGSRQDFLFAFDPAVKKIEVDAPAEQISKPEDSPASQSRLTKAPENDQTKITKPQEIDSPGELILRKDEPVKEKIPAVEQSSDLQPEIKQINP